MMATCETNGHVFGYDHRCVFCKAEQVMTSDQEYHLNTIKLRFYELVDAKYRKGASEHGGNLWEKGVDYFIDAAIDEAIDQVTYLLTLKEALAAERRTNLQDREEHL